MAIISAFTLVRAISLFHITAAYFFVVAPKIIADQNVVFILGESMKLQHATAFDKPTDATAFVGVLLAFLGISDLTAAAGDEPAAMDYWISNVQVRLAFLFGLTGYVYLFKEGGVFGAQSLHETSIGDSLQNSLVFTFGFMEIAVWFWVFTSLREEKRAIALARLEKLKAEEDRL